MKKEDERAIEALELLAKSHNRIAIVIERALEFITNKYK